MEILVKMSMLISLKPRSANSLMLASAFALSACGGSGGGADNTLSSDSSAVEPVITDNVLWSITPGSDVVATINKAGYLRAYDLSSSQPIVIATGTLPMTGSANAATGDGWLLSSGVFAKAAVSLNSNPGTTTYTLEAASGSGQASNSTMQLADNLEKPTSSSLAGDFETGSINTLVSDGSSFAGIYGGSCAWSGTLSPNSNTVDVTDITFKNLPAQTGVPTQTCPYAGKVFAGTAYLLGPSAAYPKGAIDVIFDDGGSNMPTSIHMYNFIRQ